MSAGRADNVAAVWAGCHGWFGLLPCQGEYATGTILKCLRGWQVTFLVLQLKEAQNPVAALQCP